MPSTPTPAAPASPAPTSPAPTSPAPTSPAATLGPIVSSAHLASGAIPALSEFEFGLILVG
ncbi:hypothetical protein ABTQ05_21850, partial [Acinetobacter baumannii]